MLGFYHRAFDCKWSTVIMGSIMKHSSHNINIAWLSTMTTVYMQFCVGIPGEPKKNPPYDFCWYYSNAWEFLYEILHNC